MTMPEMLTGTFAVGGLTIEADANGEKRILAGLAVPYGEIGFTSWGPTRFEPGSLDAATGIPVVRAHDDDRLIGLVQASQTTDKGVDAKVKVSKIDAGNDVLILAEDGALTGFSGSWKPTKYSFETDDIYGEVAVIEAADWVHLSVVTTPAFDSARITQVAAARGASHPPQEGPTVNLKQLLALLKAADASKRGELLAEHADLIKSFGVTIADVHAMLYEPPTVPEVTAELVEPDNTALTAAVEAMTALGEELKAGITAIRERPAAPPLEGGHAARPFLNAGDYAATAIYAAKGSVEDQARLQAALTTVDTTGNTGLVPPNYTADIIGNLPVWTPVLDTCVRHEPLPATGMATIKPSWTTLPEGDWYTSQNGEPATGAVSIGTEQVDYQFWSHAIRSSIVLTERSTFGGFAQRYYEGVAMSFASDKETKALTTMLAAANNVSSVGLDPANPLTAIAALIQALVDNQTDANGNFRGLRPNFIGMDAYAFGKLIKKEGVFQFTETSARADSFDGTLAGVRLLMIPGLGHGDYLAGSSAATVVSDDSSMQLRSLIVNTNSYELGVLVGAAFDVEYPDALAKLTQGS